MKQRDREEDWTQVFILVRIKRPYVQLLISQKRD